MTALKKIDGIADLAPRYGAIFCDAWGVIHGGQYVFDGVEQALTEFRRTRGPVIILTNAPKPSSVIPGQLDRIGLSRDAYDAVVTSGDATRAEIVKHAGEPAFFIGWRSDDALFDGMDLTLSDIDEAAYILCTGLFDEGPHDPAGYKPILERAARRNLPMVCANPDIVVRWRGELMFCAGAIAQVYEELGGKVVYAGKPHAPVYDLAFAAASAQCTIKLEPSQVLAIGDGARTDVLGANRAGIDVLYVTGAGGVHEGNGDLDSAQKALDEAGVHALGMMEGLKW